MLLGILSDIHGNAVALDAVLADAKTLGVDSYLVLGDHVAIGVEPVAVLERLCDLPNARFIRGNTDRYVVTGDGPSPTASEARANPGLVDKLVSMTKLFVWTRGYLNAYGWFDWLADLPIELRFSLPDGTTILAVHASPGRDDGSGFHPGLSNEEMESLVFGAEAELVCVGHSHQPVYQKLKAVDIVNPGSVSNPFGPDLRASYAIIDATTQGYKVFHRRIPYDHDIVIDLIRRSHHPEAEFIVGFQNGQHIAATPHLDHQPVSLWT